MKKYLAATTLAAVLGLGACTDNTTTDTAATPPGSDAAPDAADPPMTTGTAADGSDLMANVNVTAQEREALGALHVVNEHEVAAANQALSKNIAGEAADYARRMVAEHTRNRDLTRAMNPDTNATMAAQQRAKGAAELERLSKLDGDAYRNAYIEAMVKDHSEALDMLDNKLIPAATTPQVQDHLRRTREAIAGHLAEAQRLQQAGQGAGS